MAKYISIAIQWRIRPKLGFSEIVASIMLPDDRSQKEDLSPDFAEHIQIYLYNVQKKFRQGILDNYGQEM